MDDTKPPDDNSTPDSTTDSTPDDAPRSTPDNATDSPPSDPRVVTALDRLRSLDEIPVDEHVAVYAAAHRDLRDALAEAASRDTTDQA